MNHSAEMILLILAILFALPGVYLGLLTVAGLCARALRPTKGEREEDGIPTEKIAVLVPSHNEENLIAGTVAALRQCQYPSENLQIFVIADNCSDSTAIIARAAGATVLERHDTENPGKGQALDWAIRSQHDALSEFGIISILDADTLAHPQFLTEIDHEFRNAKIQAVQGYYGTSNLDAGWRPALSEVAFAVSHHLRPLGRNALRSTAGLKGNGMAFRSDLLLETGWPAHSLVEDLEFTLMLLERGVKVQYCPSARVAAEMVTQSEAATTQRMRWEGGRGQVLREFGPRMLKLWLKTRKFAALESLADLLFPPLALFVIPGAALFIGLLLSQNFIPAAVVGFGLMVVPAHVCLALLHRGVPARVWKSLVAVPLFLLWKIPVYLKLASRGTGTEWKRTKRESEEEGESSSPKKSRYVEYALTNPNYDYKAASEWRRRSIRRRATWQRLVTRAERLKRALDVSGSLFAILLLSPVLILTAILIWLEDRGPIFFHQERVGKDGKPFTMIKFRSMRTDAEKVREELDEENEHDIAVTFKIKKDPRVTRIGRYIRKFSIDEMPQFFNVLRGDMSLIGPRPALKKEVELYESFQLRRMGVKPGISCLWQIKGRSDINFEGQVRLDLEYIHSESFWQDIVICLKTVPAVVLARGAY